MSGLPPGRKTSDSGRSKCLQNKLAVALHLTNRVPPRNQPLRAPHRGTWITMPLITTSFSTTRLVSPRIGVAFVSELIWSWIEPSGPATVCFSVSHSRSSLSTYGRVYLSWRNLKSSKRSFQAMTR